MFASCSGNVSLNTEVDLAKPKEPTHGPAIFVIMIFFEKQWSLYWSHLFEHS